MNESKSMTPKSFFKWADEKKKAVKEEDNWGYSNDNIVTRIEMAEVIYEIYYKEEIEYKGLE